MFHNFEEKDQRLFEMLRYREILKNVDIDVLDIPEFIDTYDVIMPDKEYSFLHEAAIIEYHGVLFASWYNCSVHELQGRTPVRGKRSYDGGKTWSEIEVVADDESGKIIYCPPVYGICDDRLYMLINEMVSADHMHAIDLFVYNEESGKFEFVWSKPGAFKLNTNVYRLANGKLMLPGRTAPEIDGFPRTPAVLISDSGKIDGEWRMVCLQQGEFLPDGTQFDHPETSAVVIGETVYVFCRNDYSRVPVVYISQDNGETWSEPVAHNIPFLNSKIYSGTLSDGRCFVIGNIDHSRETLVLFVSKKGEFVFDRAYLLKKGRDKDSDRNITRWHYPSACEADGKLFVIYTAGERYGDVDRRGAVVSVIPLDRI